MGSRVYVSNQNSNTISVIDTLDNSITSIPLAIQPGALAVNAAGTRLFVANPADDSVSIINAVNKSLISTVTMSTSCQPQGVAIGPVDGSGNYNAFISCYGTAKMAVINANDTGSYVKNATEALVPSGPRGIAVSADGKKVFVASFNASKLTVVNALDLTQTLSIAVGLTPWGVAVDPTIADSANTTRVYVANTASDSVSAVDASGSGVGSMAVVATKSVGTMPIGIAFTPDGVKAITADNNYNSLGTASIVLKSNNNVATTTGSSGAGVIGTGPYSFGKFAGPDFVAVTTGVNDYNCGSVTTAELITPNASGVYQVAKSQNITFDITPFTNCSISDVALNGGSIGAVSSRVINATTAQDLYASFTRTAYVVTVSKTGTGSGKVVSTISTGGPYIAGGGIDCGTSCSGTSNAGTKILLTPTADPGSAFTGWTGVCGGLSASCGFTLDQATASLKGADGGTFTTTAIFNLQAGNIRTNRGGTVQYKSTLDDAYSAIAQGTALNPIDTKATPDISLNNCTLGTSSSIAAVTIVGGWADYTTNSIGTIAAGTASVINTAACTTNAGKLTIAYGSVTLGSNSEGRGAVIIK
ncbi:YncE family protein [Citrifermentans pelophilum]|nr:YncE family protein [Geoanaerobacter pelophilus]